MGSMRRLGTMLLGLVVVLGSSWLACRKPTVENAHPQEPAFAAITVPPPPADEVYERFFVIGDQGTGQPEQQEVADAMVRQAKLGGLDFVLTTGNNFYPRGVRSADDPKFKSLFEDVYDHPALSVPFYFVVGERDRMGSIRALVDYGRHRPHLHFDGEYGDVQRTLPDGTTLRIFMLDTTALNREFASGDEQAIWLDRLLAASDADWKIVVGQHPLYSAGDDPRRDIMVGKLEHIFTGRKVDVYFSAHQRTLQMVGERKGVYYAISGSAGGGNAMSQRMYLGDNVEFATSAPGFIACRISKDQLLLEFVRANGLTEYAYVIRKDGESGPVMTPDAAPTQGVDDSIEMAKQPDNPPVMMNESTESSGRMMPDATQGTMQDVGTQGTMQADDTQGTVE